MTQGLRVNIHVHPDYLEKHKTDIQSLLLHLVLLPEDQRLYVSWHK